MKKLFSILVAIAFVITLSACTPETVEIEIIKEVIIPGETIEITKEVPANVINDRSYKPGNYFNFVKESGENGKVTMVNLFVDSYGTIAGVAYNDTDSRSSFKADAYGNLYVLIKGDGVTVPNAYRRLDNATVAPEDYPKKTDAITDNDLIYGLHGDDSGLENQLDQEIKQLITISTYETARVLGLSWIKDADLLAEKIVNDQTTYGIQTKVVGDKTTAINVVGVDLTNVDVLIDLVQEILDGEAALGTTDTVEEPVTTNEYGETVVEGTYTPGLYYAHTPRDVDFDSGLVQYVFGYIVVDQYGVITGVEFDKSTKGGTESVLDSDFAGQTALYADSFVKNQGYISATKVLDTEDLDEDGEETEVIAMYADNIAGVTIDILPLVDVQKEIALVSQTIQDSVYHVSNDDSFLYLTVKHGKIQDVYYDELVQTDTAYITDEDGDQRQLYTYDRQKSPGIRVESETLLIYEDGNDYIYAGEEEVLEDGYETGYTVGADIEFHLDEDQEIDELATLMPVQGNYTKQGLDSDWGVAIRELSKKVVGETNSNVFDLNADLGVSLEDVQSFQVLLNEALIQAQDVNNAIYGLLDIYKDKDKVKAVEEFAEGAYYGASSADKNGDQAFVYFVIDNVNGDGTIGHSANGYDRIINLYMDVTTVGDDGKLTTYTMLGDDESFSLDEENEEEGATDDDTDWYETVGRNLTTNIGGKSYLQEYANEITKQSSEYADGYSYETDEPLTVTGKLTKSDLHAPLENQFIDAVESAINDALLAVVSETANLYLDQFSDLADPVTGVQLQSKVKLSASTVAIFTDDENGKSLPTVTSDTDKNIVYMLGLAPYNEWVTGNYDDYRTKIINDNIVDIGNDDIVPTTTGTVKLFDFGTTKDFTVEFNSADEDILEIKKEKFDPKEILSDSEVEVELILKWNGIEYTRTETFKVLTASTINGNLAEDITMDNDFYIEDAIDVNGDDIKLPTVTYADFKHYNGNPLKAENVKWTDEAGDPLLGTNILPVILSGGRSITKTLVLSITYKTDSGDEDISTITKEFTYRLLTKEDAITQVLNEAKAGNILNDGKVTIEGNIELDEETSVYGLRYVWFDQSRYDSYADLSVTQPVPPVTPPVTASYDTLTTNEPLDKVDNKYIYNIERNHESLSDRLHVALIDNVNQNHVITDVDDYLTGTIRQKSFAFTKLALGKEELLEKLTENVEARLGKIDEKTNFVAIEVPVSLSLEDFTGDNDGNKKYREIDKDYVRDNDGKTDNKPIQVVSEKDTRVEVRIIDEFGNDVVYSEYMTENENVDTDSQFYDKTGVAFPVVVFSGIDPNINSFIVEITYRIDVDGDGNFDEEEEDVKLVVKQTFNIVTAIDLSTLEAPVVTE